MHMLGRGRGLCAHAGEGEKLMCTCWGGGEAHVHMLGGGEAHVHMLGRGRGPGTGFSPSLFCAILFSLCFSLFSFISLIRSSLLRPVARDRGGVFLRAERGGEVLG